jgi:hypothetical protein
VKNTQFASLPLFPLHCLLSSLLPVGFKHWPASGFKTTRPASNSDSDDSSSSTASEERHKKKKKKRAREEERDDDDGLPRDADVMQVRIAH